MSDFYSRCLSCGVDLPRGLRFCTELCKERWHAKHDGEPVARVMTDEWPLVERETAVQAGNLGNSSPRDVGRGASIPTATLTREEQLQDHDPRSCEHPRCRLLY